ncbi:MAG: dihydropteroate synthase [Aphanocapsa feldmannii 288cV]|nr:MAG: dihydropteroate synthase [Aphanocapsa feldmannii 288cV]
MGSHCLDGRRTLVMGVLNVTPDSFSDGGRFHSLDAALKATGRYLAEGADLIDIGGQSTRPGAVEVSVEEELARVVPLIRALRGRFGPAPVLSLDTFRADVAQAGLEAGVDWINDVSGGSREPRILAVAAAADCPLVLMHLRGNSRTMNDLAHYGDVVAEVEQVLQERSVRALGAGVRRERILWDPGLGFAKTTAHNLSLLQALPRLRAHGYPLLVGPSRKRFIGELLAEPRPRARIWGTAATVCRCIAAGVDVVRVHDVGPMVQVARMADALWRPGAAPPGGANGAPRP